MSNEVAVGECGWKMVEADIRYPAQVRRAGAERPWTNATGGHNWKDVKGCRIPSTGKVRQVNLYLFSSTSGRASLLNLLLEVPAECLQNHPHLMDPSLGSMSQCMVFPLVLWSFKPTWRGTFTQKRRSPTFKVAWILGERVLPTNITTSVEPSCVGSLLWAIGPQSLGIEASRCIIERERGVGRKENND